MKPFIPRWLDDAQLKPHEFRVLAHLWRRADPAGRSWPSAESIATACRMNRDTVWPSIERLESLGFLIRTKGPRNANVYTVREPVGGNEGPSLPIESAEKEGHHPAEKEGLVKAEKEGRQSAEKRGHKGYPLKVPQEGSPKKGGSKSRRPPPRLSISECFKVAKDLGCSPELTDRLFADWSQRKRSYRDEVSADYIADFITQTTSGRQAQHILREREDRKSTYIRALDGYVEPAKVPAPDEWPDLIGDPTVRWEALSGETQGYVLAHIANQQPQRLPLLDPLEKRAKPLMR